MGSKAQKVSELIKYTLKAAKPKLDCIAYYAKAELAPPKPSDIGAARRALADIITGFRTKRYSQVTVREAWLNTLVTIEVICWFYVGECIGKRHLVGYDV